MDAGLLSRVQRHIGVTRVARITGLDRTGVEVACAIRPLGHVLQVCNGKGLSFGAAAAGAVMEAAELFCAERPDASELTWGKEAELRERFPGAVWGRDGIGSAALRVAPAFAGAGVRIAWRWAEELLGRKRVLVPANAVHCPPADGPWLGPAALSWNSNGSAAHPERRAALRHALLEAAERDQLARALPEGWTPEEISRRMLAPPGLRDGAPRAAALSEEISGRGFRVHLFDLTPGRRQGGLGIPVAGALLVDLHEGPIPVTAGYACRPSPDEALVAALLEAAQSRLTDIHGAREDVEAADPIGAAALLHACLGARPRRTPRAMPAPGRLDGGGVLRLFRRAGHREAGAVELAPRGLGVHVLKVIVPTFLSTELL